MGERYRDEESIEENKIDLLAVIGDMIKRFRETWWLFLIIVLVGAGAGFLKEKTSYHEQYEATASFVVTAGANGNVVAGNYYNKITTEQMNATFPYILTSGALSRVVANDLGMSSVPGMISAEMLGDTNIFQIKVVAADGQTAYDILQSVINNYPQVARYVIGDTQLKLLDETGVPSQPMNQPSYKRSIALGIAGALLLCLLIMVVRTAARTTVKNQDDLKKFLNIKYLCGIPQLYFKRRSTRQNPRILVDNPVMPDIYLEAMDTLQVRLARIMKEKQMKTFMVTSALAGEGKTTTACNIALLLAQKGYKVLLLDGDLRNPSVANLFKLDKGKGGLCDVLDGEKKAEEVICRYEETSLYIIPGGTPVQRVKRLYTNNVLKELVQRYKEKMDFILIDTPPCAIMNDASLIADSVEGCVMVIRQDYARRDKILLGAEVIAQTGTLLIGCAINGEMTGIGSYGYGKYGYGRYGYGRYGYGKYGYGKKK